MTLSVVLLLPACTSALLHLHSGSSSSSLHSLSLALFLFCLSVFGIIDLIIFNSSILQFHLYPPVTASSGRLELYPAILWPSKTLAKTFLNIPLEQERILSLASQTYALYPGFVLFEAVAPINHPLNPSDTHLDHPPISLSYKCPSLY